MGLLTMRNFLVVLLLIFPGVVCAQTPLPAIVDMAYEDAKSLPEDVRPYTRYLSLGHLPPASIEDWYLGLSGHIHHLSTSSFRERPKLVPGTAGRLIRLDIRDYHWDARKNRRGLNVWEQMLDAEPFYHSQLITETETKTIEWWPGGKYNGKYEAPNSFRYYVIRKDRKQETAHAPWLGDPKKVKELGRLVYSNIPIVYGDWFFWQTCIQQNRKPGYYDFLGIDDEASFEKLIGLDKKLAATFGDDLRSSVGKSGVTTKARAMIRRMAGGGGSWQSFDFDDEAKDSDPRRIFGKDIEKAFAATERYGLLANRFWATGLFTGPGNKKLGAGVRQDVAPGFIASDKRSRSNDTQVHVNFSCVRCHINGGLQDIRDFARNAFQPPFKLNVKDYHKYKQLQSEYMRGLESFLSTDRAQYATAVKEVTGWDTIVYARKYSEMWYYTEDADVDLERAARDLGVSQKHFAKALRIQVQLQKADPLLGSLLLEGDRKETISYREWQTAYPLAQAYLVGVQSD